MANSRIVTGSTPSSSSGTVRTGGTTTGSVPGRNYAFDQRLGEQKVVEAGSLSLSSDGTPVDVPSVFQGSNGEKVSYSGISQDVQSYMNVYELIKNYPQWVALLDANPYTGFNIPQSLFDKLGLSNKAVDKMNALRQEYMNYNAQVLANFMNWKNSLASTQREQLNEAGYASDLANVQPSNVPTEIPQGSNALAMPSGCTAEDLLQVVGTAAQLSSLAVGNATAIMSTISNVALQSAQKRNLDKQTVNLGLEGDFLVEQTNVAKKQGEKLGSEIANIKKQGESLDLSNFNSSLDIAKRIYSNLAPSLQNPKDPDEIMAALSLQYPDAPDSVNKALQNYVNSREFQSGLQAAETGLLDNQSAFMSSYMTNKDLNLLVGSPEYWLGIKNLTFKTYKKQLETIDDYLDTLDTVKMVRSQNAYYDYMNEYYTQLNSLGVPALSAQAAISQNKASIASYDLQSDVARRNREILTADFINLDEKYNVLTNPDASSWSRWWAANSLQIMGTATRWSDPKISPTIVSPFTPGVSMPTIGIPTIK